MLHTHRHQHALYSPRSVQAPTPRPEPIVPRSTPAAIRVKPQAPTPEPIVPPPTPVPAPGNLSPPTPTPEEVLPTAVPLTIQRPAPAAKSVPTETPVPVDLAATPTAIPISAPGPTPPADENLPQLQLGSPHCPTRNVPKIQTFAGGEKPEPGFGSQKKVEVLEETIGGKKIEIPLRRDKILYLAPNFGQIPQEWAWETINVQQIRVL